MQCTIRSIHNECSCASIVSAGVTVAAVSSGTFGDVHHDSSPPGDPVTADLFSKEDPILQAFAFTKVSLGKICSVGMLIQSVQQAI